MKRILSVFALFCLAALSAGAQDIKRELQQKLATVKESVAQNQAAPVAAVRSSTKRSSVLLRAAWAARAYAL